MQDFPLLGLGFTAARKGAGYPIAFNAANEEAVAAFLEGNMRFTQLAEVTGAVLERNWNSVPTDFEAVMSADADARRYAQECIKDYVT